MVASCIYNNVERINNVKIRPFIEHVIPSIVNNVETEFKILGFNFDNTSQVFINNNKVNANIVSLVKCI